MPPSYASDEVRMVFPFAYYLFWIVIGIVLVALGCGAVIAFSGIVESLRGVPKISSSAYRKQ